LQKTIATDKRHCSDEYFWKSKLKYILRNVLTNYDMLTEAIVFMQKLSIGCINQILVYWF